MLIEEAQITRSGIFPETLTEGTNSTDEHVLPAFVETGHLIHSRKLPLNSLDCKSPSKNNSLKQPAKTLLYPDKKFCFLIRTIIYVAIRHIKISPANT